jgi:hypothetical protein
VELIVSRNDIESDTDMIAVWLFVAQVVLMLMPDPWRILLTVVRILWDTVSALVSGLGWTLWWIVSSPKRLARAISNWWTQSKTSNVLPERRPSEESAVIKLEEGTQKDLNALEKQDSPEALGGQQDKNVLLEAPSDPSPVIQLEEGAQQNSDVLPKYSLPEAPAVVQLEGAEQTSNVLPKPGPSEASAVIQLDGPQQNSNVGPAEVSEVQLEQGAQQNASPSS